MTGTLLIDADSRIPNLALMHISAWEKAHGRDAGFYVSDPDRVYASIVFTKNRHLADGLRFLYPDAVIDIGGTGYDLKKALPPEMDRMMPDYTLYPGMDYDLGFTSRGCDRRCPFCFVPSKEGRFRRHQHPSEFHDPAHRKVVLLDNNILLDKGWFFEVTDWILEKGLKVDFNQGLDIRLMDSDVAARLTELDPIGCWHFAFDSLDYKDAVGRGIGMLDDAGLNVRSKAMFYVYLKDDGEFTSALERCELLKSWGATPYIMTDPTSKHTRRMKDLKRWARPWIFWKTDFSDYKKRNE